MSRAQVGCSPGDEYNGGGFSIFWSDKSLLRDNVIMGDRPAAERACKDPNPIIDGRKANVNLAILGAKPRGTLPPGKLLHPLMSY
ncbi:hypothetical protein M8J77_007598 [Diaphorina citri]|nr:hypothetical protein M8J77_007598 [Diaphorina citri]